MGSTIAVTDTALDGVANAEPPLAAKPRPTRRADGAVKAAKVTPRSPANSWKFKEKQHKIIAEVRNLLIEDGYANLSLRRLAQRCKMRLGNLQYYYPTRDSLVIAFIGEWIRMEVRERHQLALAEGNMLLRANQWVEDFFNHLSKASNRILLSEVWAMASHDDVARETLSGWYEDMRHFYSGLVRVANPKLSQEEAEQRTMLLISLVEGLAPQLNHVFRPEFVPALVGQMRKAVEAIILAE